MSRRCIQKGAFRRLFPWAVGLAAASLPGGARLYADAEAQLVAEGEPSPNPSSEEAAKAADAEATTNKRMATLEGSKSRWSGQFQLQYSGSTLNHPFSASAPNPGHLTPAPVVTMAGTFSARYRIDDKTTAGLGTGLTTQTPFQGPKKTTLADPYVDVARSFTIGVLHSRADVQLTKWTNDQYFHDLGYRGGTTILDETFYEFPFGLTAGLALQVDGNTFAKGGPYDASQQTAWDIAVDPYVEYVINDMLNFRSVIGIIDYKNRNLYGTSRYAHPDVYQTLGLGIAATKAVFVYAYAQIFPYSGKPVASDNSMFGFSAIVNLF